jgi:hypothetical protein
MRVFAAGVLVVSLFGCKKDEPYDPDQGAKLQAKWKAEVEAQVMAPERRGPGFAIKPEAPPPAAEAKPGPAYLFVDEIGLAKLDGGKITMIPSPLPLVSQIAIDKNGTPYVVDSGGVWKLEGDQLVRLGPKPELGQSVSYDRIAFAPDGTIWARGGFDIHHWNGTAWTRHEKPLGETLPGSIAVDGKGRVFAGAHKVIKVFDGAWKPVLDLSGVSSVNNVEPPLLLELLISQAGELLVTSHRALFKLDGKNLVHVEREKGESLYAPLVALLGNDMISVNSEYRLRVPLAGGADQVAKLEKVSVRSGTTLDAAGRAWLPTDDGFVVVGADGATTKFPAGSFPEIAATIQAIGVVGSGPELPQVGEIAKGSIKGVVTKAGDPIASVPVEVCRWPRSEFPKDSTPCASEKLTGKGKTGAKGEFQIDDLPLLDYRVVLEVSGQWYGLQGKACKGLAAGAVCDVGVLDITAKPTWP